MIYKSDVWLLPFPDSTGVVPGLHDSVILKIPPASTVSRQRRNMVRQNYFLINVNCSDKLNQTELSVREEGFSIDSS